MSTTHRSQPPHNTRKMSKSLAGKICLVTGGTRGIGRGIAVQLGAAGATVYVTGRTLKPRPGQTAGSLEDTAKEIESRGGRCIPVVCDHSVDDQVKALFDRIQQEQDGQLDVLVNNAYAAVQAIFRSIGVPFWEHDITMWDTVNNVGLRNHYLCTVYAARMMVPRKQGLIVNVSSAGGLRYLFNIPYGVGKEALDRMAADCAIELRRSKVAVISLWPGSVQTEEIQATVGDESYTGEYHQPGIGTITAKRMREVFETGETSEASGKCIVQLASDPDIMKKSGRIHMTCDLADEYDFKDVDGRVIRHMRSVGNLLNMAGWKKLSLFFPTWMKIPRTLIALAGSKF